MTARFGTLTLVSLTSIFMLAACAKEPAPVDTAKVSDEVKAAISSAIAGFNAKDAAKATAIDAPDYVGMFHGAPNVVGAEQDLELTKLQVASLSGALTVADEKVDVASSGDMAVWSATYAYPTTDPKTRKPVTEVGNWVVVFRKQPDGTMKAKLGIVSDTPAAAAGAATPK